MSQDTEFKGHSGDLKFDAPAAYSKLSEKIPNSELHSICQLYSLRCEILDNPFEDLTILRSPQTNFNPFPARVCALLIKEAPHCSIECLIAPFVLGLEQTDRLNNFGTLVQTAVKIAANAGKWPNNHSIWTDSEALALAMKLDRARHLHMSNLPLELQVEEFKLVKNIFITHNIDQKNSRLKLLLEHWVKLVKNKYERA